MSVGRKIAAVLGLLLVLAASVLPIGKYGIERFGLGHTWGQEAAWWALAGVLVLWVVVIERQPLTSIGVRKLKLWDVVLAILAGLIAFFGIGLVYSLLLPAIHVKASAGTATASGIIALPIWLRVAMVLRAAVVEEVIWRGYGIERLSSLTGSRPFAAFLTLAGFTYAHLAGWGAAHLVAAGFAGLIITLFYLWRRNLVAAMIAHGVTDALAFLVLPLLSSLPRH